MTQLAVIQGRGESHGHFFASSHLGPGGIYASRNCFRALDARESCQHISIWALIGALLASAFGVMVFSYALVWLPSFRHAESSPRELILYFSIGGNGFGILLGILLARAKSTYGLAAIVAADAACYVLAWLALPDIGAGRGLFLILLGHIIRTAFAFALAVTLAGAVPNRHAFAGDFVVWRTCELRDFLCSFVHLAPIAIWWRLGTSWHSRHGLRCYCWLQFGADRPTRHRWCVFGRSV